MVHLRLNERETNPNPHINFISALHAHSEEDRESARQLLLALAAQVRPVMKDHGFAVNSLEEYEHNKVFLGRNWNAGETIEELVLRRPDGSFMPTHFIMSTLCHEHMNHGPDFQKLWKQLRIEVRSLQDRGYYGDGYWSSGTRLGDSAQIEGQGVASSEYMPEYMCGGAQSRTRPTAIRRRRGGPRRPRETVASLHTGRQTAKRRKAGARVTSKYAFEGEGATLGEAGGKGAGFRKQAARWHYSKSAREERLAAIEKRLRGLQGSAASTTPPEPSPDVLEIDSDSDEEDRIEETDYERRQRLKEAEDGGDGVEGIISWDDYADDFIFGKPGGSATDPTGPSPPASSSTRTPTSKSTRTPTSKASGSATKGKAPASIGLGKLVQSEIDLREKEAVGLAPVKNEATRKLGGRPQARKGERAESKWSCLACTFINAPGHLACSICATPRGGSLAA
ncbi:WLM-domain-containing protein [Schizophyllum commune H4-8]|uniref:WLM domain-containing protein n=1 Tax=Schizophyllum commune (strain H4-8 / FGSC 9210) TaxID=578458 RepID=D8QA79_SCHCM|nr:WLM-domain-containing protein [Schizophyllum commune H4-8]KAI5890112.1 WLM-domain-containing protein [Schizophyllum commune H4-8]